MRNALLRAASTLIVLAGATPALWAHFPWLVVREDPGTNTRWVELYFGEDAAPGDAELLRYVKEAEVFRGVDGSFQPVAMTAREDRLVSPALEHAALYRLRLDLGTMERHGERFRLVYHALGAPALGESCWDLLEKDRGEFGIVPSVFEGGLTVQVLFRGEPTANAQVVVIDPEGNREEAKTDEWGRVRLFGLKPGTYAVRARHEEAPGNGDHAAGDVPIRHHATCTFAMTRSQARSFPALPELVTSFGAAVHANRLYFYGGHTGDPHSYSELEQGNTLWHLNLEEPRRWEAIEGPVRAQGLALVACGDALYRIGGFSARNAKGEEAKLHSRADVHVFDLATKSWREGPALPEPRSSFDAAVIDRTIYVVGGWNMQGSAETVWHETALALDTTADEPRWEEIAEPPFQRRALAVAAHAGKLYAIGGMDVSGSTSPRVDVYDPATKGWERGPDLPGEGNLAGFGCSAFSAGGALYASTVEGHLLRLGKNGERFETVAELPSKRFFHRLLALSDHELVILGGANMRTGKWEGLEVFDLTRFE